MSLWVVAAYLVAHAIFYAAGKLADSKGVDRTPERQLSYSSGDLRTIAKSGARYIMPVLFPADLVVMLALAGSLYWAALYWSPYDALSWPALIYLAFDLAEDGFLAAMLAGHVPISDRTVSGLKVLTIFKFGAIVAAEVIAAAAFVTAAYRFWVGD